MFSFLHLFRSFGLLFSTQELVVNKLLETGKPVAGRLCGRECCQHGLWLAHHSQTNALLSFCDRRHPKAWAVPESSISLVNG